MDCSHDVSLSDIRQRVPQALTADQERLARAWIGDAGDALGDLAGYRIRERLALAEPGLAKRVHRAVRDAVVRRLKNPEGRRQYSYTVDDATVSETLATETLADGWFTAEELARLAPAGAASPAFSIRMDGPAIAEQVRPWGPLDERYPWVSL